MGKIKKMIKDAPTQIKVLPKRDFLDAIKHDEIYLDKYNTFIATASELLKKLGKHKNITSDAQAMYDYAKVDMEMADVISKANVQSKLIADRKRHYEFVFTPMYNKQVAEMNKEWESTITRSEQIAKLKDKSNEFLAKIKGVVAKFNKTDKCEEEKNEAYKKLKRFNRLWAEADGKKVL